MHVFNSFINLNQDDTDTTIINHSLLYNDNDEPIKACIPIVRRLQQANQSKSINNPINSDDKPDDIYINHYRLETAKQIEQILNYYRQDLKQESNTQLNCNQQLITRLIDFIRPVYSSNEKQMKDLDILYDELSILNNERFLEQKEKTEQLNNQIRHLKKSIITTPIEDDDRDSLMTNLYRMNSMCHYDEWHEMEQETKQLHNLVNKQREQIDKLIELLTEPEITNNEKYPTTANSLNISTRILPNNTTKKCPVCNYEFPIIFSEVQIMSHVEKCLPKSDIIDSNVSIESKPMECPYCNEKLPNNDDIDYIQHLSQCFNEMTGQV